MEEGCFTFIWKINCFNELVSRHPNGTFFYSERFWSPRGNTGKCIILNIANQRNVNNNNSIDYLWRLKLFPNGVDKKSAEFISLYLEAIQTQYERQNGIIGRHKKFRLALYRLGREQLNTIQEPNLIIDRHILETNFEFNGVNADYGFARIISLKDLYPNESYLPNLPEMDLMVRAEIFDDLTTTTTTTMTHGEGSSLMNVIPEYYINSLLPFERFFSENLFCDVEFLFDCGSNLKAHRVILAARSEYFERLLGGEWLEGHMKTITIKDMPYLAFRCIVYHLYTGKLEDGLNFDLLKDVYSKADMLNINELTFM
ncbi:2328_t:CDS:1, partial [Diversispora eburnea]